jgi:hypothetical protein
VNTSTPAAQLRLSEFIETIEEAKKANPEFETWDFRYWRLPAREAVFLMLTGQGDEESVKWRNTRPGDPRYCLKLFDEKGEYAPVGAEFLQQGGNLPESLFVRLEEVALHYLTSAGNGYCCICIPWRDTQGNLMVLREAAGLCKRVFIPYLTAKQILEARLHDVTAKEIALWLAYGNEGITAKDSEWANARDETFRHPLGIAEFHPAAKPTTLEDLLSRLYFSEEELKTANPRRWRSYDWLKQWAADRGAEEADLLAIIKPCFLVLDNGQNCFCDGRISDPTPVSAALKETQEDLAQRAMYREDWIQAVNEDKFPDREAKQSLLAEKAAKQKAERLAELACQAELDMEDVLYLLGWNEPKNLKEWPLSEHYQIDINGIRYKWAAEKTRLEFPCTPMAFVDWCKAEEDKRDKYGLKLHTLLLDFVQMVGTADRGDGVTSAGQGVNARPLEADGLNSHVEAAGQGADKKNKQQKRVVGFIDLSSIM